MEKSPSKTISCSHPYRHDVRGTLPFLNSLGITMDSKTLRPRTDPKTLESAREGIYLAGVIVAGMHTSEIFIENGRFHGKQIAEAIAAKIAQPAGAPYTNI